MGSAIVTGWRKARRLSGQRIVFSPFAGVSLRADRRQVSPLRSETPKLRFGPSGDSLRPALR